MKATETQTSSTKFANLDKLVKALTGFRDWADLTSALDPATNPNGCGYVPTMRRGDLRQRVLGLAVEVTGRRVYWID